MRLSFADAQAITYAPSQRKYPGERIMIEGDTIVPGYILWDVPPIFDKRCSACVNGGPHDIITHRVLMDRRIEPQYKGNVIALRKRFLVPQVRWKRSFPFPSG